MEYENIKREKVLHGCDSLTTIQPLRTFTTAGIEIFVNIEDYKWVGCSEYWDFYSLKRK